MNRQQWISKCQHWKNKWPVMQDEWKPTEADTVLNLYAVLDAVNQYSTNNDILMGDAGSISYAGPVALNAKSGQRFVFSPAQADMGWALPGAIGVAMASDRPVISIIGDGSFMSNLQELAVVKQHELNIKYIILNNGGYLSIKNTQSKYYDGRVYGTGAETGVWFPNFADIALSFGINYALIRTAEDLKNLSYELSATGPAIIDCMCLPDQEILPAQALKNGKQAGLHDMAPFLSDDEISQEMIVKI